MSTQITPAPDDPQTNSEDIQEILVDFDEKTDTVTVTPQEIEKGATVRFRNPQGIKLRIEFVLPDGKGAESVSDSDVYTLSVGGTFHFKCFFTMPGATKEVYATGGGGVIDILPRRP